jgi:tripartite ATP-independent transporter DctM subunit
MGINIAALLIATAIALLATFALSFHVASALGLTAFVVGITQIGDVSEFFGQIPWNLFSGTTIIVVPLFVLMGEILLRSGITEELYETLAQWMGRLPGGLLHTNILASGFFAAICGSSVATATTIGGVAMPSMRKYGYDERLAVGSIASGGTLGILIPPSIIMIVYGLMAEVSIAKLYMAGIVPGLLMMLAFMAVVMVVALISPAKAPAMHAMAGSLVERLKGLYAMLPVIVLMAMVLGTIYAGVATATEAAAFGCTGALLVALLKGRVNRAMLRETFRATAATTGMVLLVLAGAFLLQFILSLAGVPMLVSKWIVGLGLSEIQLILLLCAIYLLLGMFMESLAMIVTTLPIILPILVAMHVDLIWFGIIATILVELSLITPPVGMNLFVMQAVRSRLSPGEAGRSMNDVYLGVLPFIGAMVAVLAGVIFYPDLALALVKAMG